MDQDLFTRCDCKSSGMTRIFIQRILQGGPYTGQLPNINISNFQKSIEAIDEVDAYFLHLTLQPTMSQNTQSLSNEYEEYVEVLQGASLQSVNYVLPQGETTGSIKEYTPVGDGAHLSPPQLQLMPFLERTRPRPNTLVRKVTVVGSYVLRYVTQNSNLFLSRPVRQNSPGTQLARTDQHANYGSAYSYEQEDPSWLSNEPAVINSSSLLQLQMEPSAQNILPNSNSDNSSLLGWLNWKIYLGMICIIVAQALLKLTFQEIYNMS